MSTEKITSEEKIIILEAMAMMCAQDGEFHPLELEFFTAIAKASGVDANEVDLHSKEDLEEHIERVSSALENPAAKKLLILVLSSCARIDDDLEESELELIEKFSKRLGMKSIDLNQFTYKDLAKKVILLIQKYS